MKIVDRFGSRPGAELVRLPRGGERLLAVEHAAALLVNEQTAFRVVCTPELLPQLALGRLLTEGWIASADEVEQVAVCAEGLKVSVHLTHPLAAAPAAGQEVPSCCTDNLTVASPVALRPLAPVPQLEVPEAWVGMLAAAMGGELPLYRATRAVHSCFLLRAGRILYQCEDLGRHNALDKAVGMIFESQYPVGGWPQRWPLMHDHPDADGTPDYSACITFNDDVTPNNIEILMRVAYVLGDARAMEPLIRAMNCMRTLQQGTPAAGWADQYYLDLTPAKARDFEPAAVSTVRTRDCIRLLMAFYRLTGDRKFLDGIPAALDFLRAAALDDAAAAGLGRKPGKGRLLCPRFVKPGTLTPLYMHRKGLHVDNGAYYIDQDPHNVIGHYAALVVIDADDLQRQYDALCALPVDEATAGSPMLGKGRLELPRYHTPAIAAADPSHAGAVLSSLDGEGRWIGPLNWVLVPYIGPGSADDPVPDTYEQTLGNPHNTASLVTEPVEGVCLRTYINNMATLIASLANRENR